MLTRRQLLQMGLLAGTGLLVPWKWTAERASAQTLLPSIIDPLYTAPIADPALIQKFVNPMPVIKTAGLRVDLTSGGEVAITMGSTVQDLLGTGHGTPVWGYAINGGPVTYPGATLVAKRGNPVTVNWINDLGYTYVLKQGIEANGDVIDRTLHWAFSPHLNGGNLYTIGSQGVPAVAHQHGGRSASAFDGLPEQWFTPSGATGQHYVSDTYIYDLDQEAATLWYHDHALGITRLNVYAGLAGFWFLRDDNEEHLINNNLIPAGDFETEIAIQDRMFYPDGRLAYPDVPWVNLDVWGDRGPSHQPEFFGQVILVNGKAWPFHNVEPRQYRFRLLNGSDSRFYVLDIKPDNTKLPSPNFWVIGTDTGLLNTPVPVNKLTIGPGERYDVVVDFSGTLDGTPGVWNGQSLTVHNSGRSPFPMGVTVNPSLDGTIMQVRVGTATSGGAIAPLTATTHLRPNSGPLPALTPPNPNNPRKLMLFEAVDHFGRLQPLLGTIDPTAPVPGEPSDGTFLWDDPITENPALGATEVWEIHNATVDAHPIHLHLVKFQILNRQKYKATVVPKVNRDHDGNITTGGALRNVQYIGQPKGPAAYEAGWKDTAIMYPGEVTRLIATFDKPGRYAWHCHILSHEDHEMMRPFEVVSASGAETEAQDNRASNSVYLPHIAR